MASTESSDVVDGIDERRIGAPPNTLQRGDLVRQLEGERLITHRQAFAADFVAQQARVAREISLDVSRV
jgi:hypothetical protein